MSGPSELSFDEILNFMLSHNGKVTNHELVKYFRVFLTNPETRDEARGIFKKHVNALASINNINNEKWLILKRKYMPDKDDASPIPKSVKDDSPTVPKPVLPPSPDPIEPPHAFSPSKPTSNYNEVTTPEPPQYRMPPPVVKSPQELVFSPEFDKRHYSPRTSFDSIGDKPVVDQKPMMECEETPPKLHPRKSSSSNIDKTVPLSNDYKIVMGFETENNKPIVPSISAPTLAEADQTVSVKERKQMFNKMASDVDVLRPRHYGNRSSLHGNDEDDRASLVSRGEVEPLDAQQKQWILLASRGDYNALSKMCHDNPKIVKTKDPFTGTAMHWACKHGNENVVKMLAGIARKLVNERSGYTPLHLAKQFRHENVYRLLIEVYDADANIRDWSGKKPKQYLASLDNALSPDAYRKFKIKADKKNLEKEGFLRIGSLNVRVKKTTEAFSNFLGVGATRSSAYVRAPPRLCEEPELRKNWGSADNVNSEQKLMPPPSSSKVRRRGRRIPHSLSTPSTPDQVRAHMDMCEQGDSDSDSAAGFPAHPRRSVPT